MNLKALKYFPTPDSKLAIKVKLLRTKESSKIFINSKVKIAFAQSDFETAEWISKIMGGKTSRIKSKSRQSHNIFNTTESEILVAERLMRPQNILQLPRKKEILIVEGYFPTICQKLYWDEEKN